ncbi:MAG: MFS transporter [Desulfobacterales bacterium]|nr:MFS transporter [Desulfobacterales bacterium]
MQNMDGISVAAKAEKPTRQRAVLVAVLLITLLVAYLDRVNISVLVADNAFLADMGIENDPKSMGLLMTLFLIAYGFANVLLAPLGDIIGPRKAMVISILLWTLSVIIGGLATTFAIMLIGRIILGVGEGMHWPMQSSFVKKWFPPNERGKANAVWLIGLTAGPMMAMPFFTWIIAHFGWRTSFFVLAFLGMIPLALLWFCVTDHPRDNKRVNAAELAMIERPLKEEAEMEARMKTGTMARKFGSFCFDYRFWLLTLSYACIASLWWGTMAWLPSYFKSSRGFSWSTTGALSSLPYVIATASVFLFGHLGDKTGRRAPFVAASHLLAATGIFFGANVMDNLSAAIVLSIGVGSLAMGLPASWVLLQRMVPGNCVGAGAGMMNGIANAGSAFVPWIIGLFIASTGSYMGGLMFLVGIGVLGCACMTILSLQQY